MLAREDLDKKIEECDDQNITKLLLEQKQLGEELIWNIHFPVEVKSVEEDAAEHALKLLKEANEMSAITFFEGADTKRNPVRVINALKKLQQDQVLPNQMLLSGYSSGGTDSIVLANEIYKVFGEQIKLHLYLIDPMAGSLDKNKAKQSVIPPNVLTFTTFYAVDETGKFHFKNDTIAMDVSKLIFTNPKTTITCYGVPGTHQTIHKDSFYIYEAFADLIFAVNNTNYNRHCYGEFTTFDPYNPKSMIGKECRKGSIYYKRTPVNTELPELLRNNLVYIRKVYERNYDESQEVMIDAAVPRFNNEKERAAYIEKVFVQETEKKAEQKNLGKLFSFFSCKLGFLPSFSSDGINSSLLHS